MSFKCKVKEYLQFQGNIIHGHRVDIQQQMHPCKVNRYPKGCLPHKISQAHQCHYNSARCISRGGLCYCQRQWPVRSFISSKICSTYSRTEAWSGHESSSILAEVSSTDAVLIPGMCLSNKNWMRRTKVLTNKIFGLILMQMKGRAPGEQLKLPAFIKAHSSELTSTYLHLSSADKNRLRENVNTYCQSHVKVTRANPKTLQKDVNTTFKTMQTEVMAQNNT